MKKLYVYVSDVELREYDVDDDVTPFDMGGACPEGCHGVGFMPALVTHVDYEKRTYRCSHGCTHAVPAGRTCSFGRDGHMVTRG